MSRAHKRLQHAEPLTQGFEALLHTFRDRQFILMGEATHGTYEFYDIRVQLTKRLIVDQGIAAVAIEGDWPSVYRVNQYVQWRGTDASANEALGAFRRFPLWMWRNSVMQEFVEWLREYNRLRAAEQQVGIYGLVTCTVFTSRLQRLRIIWIAWTRQPLNVHGNIMPVWITQKRRKLDQS